MPSPEFKDLNYTYKKPDTEVWVLNSDDIPVDKSLIKDQQIVYLAPGSVGGNHRHPRSEWFIATGPLVFVWLDDEGKKHEEQMNPDGQLKLITVPSFLPHAVINTSLDQFGVLFELADDKMKDVERIQVV